MFIVEFFILLFEIIPFFLSIAIFFPINKIKKLKTKEDELFLQKTLMTFIFFFIDIIIGILKIVKVIGNNNVLNKIVTFIFNIYIMIIIFYNFFLCLELSFTYSNPIHFFNRLFKQKKYNYVPEFFILFIAIATVIADVILYSKFKNIYENENTRIMMPNFYKFGVIVLFSLINVLICVIKKSQIKKFSFKKQDKLINVFNKRAISSTLYIIYGALYVIPMFLNDDATKIFDSVFSFVFLAIIIMDYCIHISLLATTKFCEYCLKKKLIGFICSLFFKPSKNEGEENMIPLMNDTTVNDTTTGLVTSSSLQNETTSVGELISNSPLDKELITIYKNGIFLEDYFLNFFDQILNVLTISIFQVYYSKFFSSKANDSRLSTDIDIGEEVSDIGGAYKANMSISVTGDQLGDTKSKIGDNTATFDIRKNMEKDDYSRFKDVLENGQKIENNNNYLRTKVKSFFIPRCLEIIYDQRLKGKHIGNSLLSHIILSGKNKNTENPHITFWSLTAANGKEEYFNKIKNTSFKTYDKNFNIDIFDSNDDELILKEKGKSNDISILIDKYFTYIHGKGINGTFIPSLVGVFKVKINSFKTLLVFITRNSIVENAPKNFFTYWQLIRFLNEKPEKIASSQFNDGGRATLIKDDPIFERLFQVESKKDSPDHNKINLKNYNDFQETIKSDIAFLNKCGCQNFDLLLMYYEYENTQKHEKQGAIKIQQQGDNVEIVQATMPNDIMDEFSPSVNPSNNMKFPGESMKSGMFSLGGAFLDGGEEDMGVLDINMVKQNAASLLDYSEKISMNGYEGIFDSFNCMCFFTFENIFDTRKKFTLPTNYYTNFQNNILDNFSQFKK